MKRKYDEKDRSCSSRSKLDPIPLDLKMATVTRLPAKFHMKSHQNELLCRVESSVRLGGPVKRKEIDRDEEDEKDTNPSKLDSLPLDLKMAILIRLPAKSIMKFRCVSKMWYSIIRSRGFIDSFFSMSSKQSRFIVALSNGVGVGSEPEENLTFFFSFSHEGKESSSSLVPNFEMAIPTSFSDYSHSFASFHGILAVKDKYMWYMCNPSTEQVVKLPPATALVGYDPIDDQYKALSIRRRIWNDSSGHLEHKVLTLGGGEGWRHIKDTPLPYKGTGAHVCINGFLYYAAYLTQTSDTVLVCFDVRSEKLSVINAPEAVVQWGKDAIFLEYKGKLASIVRYPYGLFHCFDLWILEDPKKHEWSKQTCVLPSSVWDDVDDCRQMSFPGTNKAGEIIIAPSLLPRNVQPFYIFYYNVETKNVRRVRLLGIGDSEEFRRSYGFGPFGSIADDYFVLIAHQHVESVGFFKDPII